MEHGPEASLAFPKSWLVAGLLLGLLGGCSTAQPRVLQAMKPDAPDLGPVSPVSVPYCIRYPDVLQVRVAARPDLSGRFALRPDGRLDAPAFDYPGIEGLTPSEVAAILAQRAGVLTAAVEADVTEYASQHIYLFGEVVGQQHAVPYRGPETVVEVLRRIGGITPNAAPSKVQVIRPNVAIGKAPQTFHVDLPAILLRNDQTTNLRVQPFDEIHVGETRQAVVGRCMPPWLRNTLRWLTSRQGGSLDTPLADATQGPSQPGPPSE